MADIKISELGAAAVVDDTDVVPATSNGVTKKVAASVLKEYMIGDTSISGIGDGSVTGAIAALNSVENTLYFTGIACAAMTGNFASKSDASITADFVVADITFSKPEAITTDVTWTTASGSLTLNGTCIDATCTASVTLIKKDN